MSLERSAARSRRKVPGVEGLVNSIGHRTTETQDRNLGWMLQELAIAGAKIPARLAKRMHLDSLHWLRFQRPNDPARLYLGFELKAQKPNLEKASAAIIHEWEKEHSVRIYSTVKDSSKKRRIVGVKYAGRGFPLESIFFSVFNLENALETISHAERYQPISTSNFRSGIITPEMLVKTVDRWVSFISTTWHNEAHSHLLHVSGSEIRDLKNIHMGRGDDQAVLSVRGIFGDYVFDFRHTPREGRVFLGNWKIALPRKLS